MSDKAIDEREIARLFDRGADERLKRIARNPFIHFRYLEKRRDIIAQVPETCEWVLDVGCNVGHLLGLIRANAASGRTKHLIGVDIALGSLQVAAATVPAGFAGASGSALPFYDAVFDVVLLSEVIEHVAHPARVIGEAARVLRPGGSLIITTPNAECVQLHVHNAIQQTLYRIIRRQVVHKDDYVGFRYLHSLLKDAGLRLVENHVWRYPNVVGLTYRSNTYGLFPPLSPSALIRAVKWLHRLDREGKLPRVVQRCFCWTIFVVAQKPVSAE